MNNEHQPTTCFCLSQTVKYLTFHTDRHHKMSAKLTLETLWH